MRRKYLVTKYEAGNLDCHLCRDEAGNTIRMDCMVDGGYAGKPEDLVGKTIKCVKSTFLYVATDVEVIA